MSPPGPLTSFSRLILRQTHPTRYLSASRTYATRNPSDQRDAQDSRHKINPQPNEYAKSGTDAEAAANDEAAFNPNISDPQEAKKEAGKGNKVNPLDASPANVELSQGTSETSPGLKKKMSEGGGGRDNGGDATGDKHGGSSV